MIKALIAKLTIRTITGNKKGTVKWLVGLLVGALAVTNPAILDALRLVAEAVLEAGPPPAVPQ